MPLTARPVFTLHVDLAEPIEVGPVPAGHRRIIPITGGTVDGPELTGTILPGGADWNLTGTDGCARLWARYDFRTDDGAIVGVINEAVHPLSTPGRARRRPVKHRHHHPARLRGVRRRSLVAEHRHLRRHPAHSKPGTGKHRSLPPGHPVLGKRSAEPA